jgi:hypothetical protein
MLATIRFDVGMRSGLRGCGAQARRASLGARLASIALRGMPRCQGSGVAAVLGLWAVAITDVIQRLIFICSVLVAGRRLVCRTGLLISVTDNLADQCGIVWPLACFLPMMGCGGGGDRCPTMGHF